MKKFTRKITEIIVHCTATPNGRDISAAEIDRAHRSRGFESIGYHYVVRLDGSIERGRQIECIGAHCLGHNDRSIGIAYVGGLDETGKPADTRTESQRQSIIRLLTELKRSYPETTIHGHNEFAAKACPCFDAAKEYHSISTMR